MPTPYESSPARGHQLVTPSDSTVFSPPFRSLKVCTAGNVAVVDEYGVAVTYTCAAGDVISVVGTKVKLTGTSGSMTIVAWF